MSTRDALDTFVAGRAALHARAVAGAAAAQRRLRARSVHPREQDVLIARMVPFVVRNYNAVELGPRGTGKSHLFQQVSPYAHLVSGGKATIANMFVNNEHGPAGPRRPVRRGLLRRGLGRLVRHQGGRQHPQGLHGVRRVQPRQGEHPRRRRHRHGRQLRRRRARPAAASAICSAPMPKEMRDDTAFMDRIHAYLPGWDVPKLDPSYFTDHFGFVSDFLAEVLESAPSHLAAGRHSGTARRGGAS